MKNVRVNLGQRSYSIWIGKGLLSQAGVKLRETSGGHRVFLVANPTVFDLYGPAAVEVFEAAGFEVVHLLIPEGERIKNLQTVENIYTYLIAQKADRHSTLVALGGGVTGDIVGFVAATLLRGVPYMQLPTTLLAQVDSSVGGKTGVNHRLGKNLIGAFYQPHLVVVDTDTLGTLPDREFWAGLYEVVKYGLIYDSEFFDDFSAQLPALLRRDPSLLAAAISRCCEIKAEVISIDETESNLRRILNFGHTLGHALEAATDYERFKHGEAVAYGMLAAAELSQRQGLLDSGELERVAETIRAIGPLPPADDVAFTRLAAALKHDKKREADQTVFILLRGIGRTEVAAGLPESLLEEVWGQALARVKP